MNSLYIFKDKSTSEYPHYWIDAWKENAYRVAIHCTPSPWNTHTVSQPLDEKYNGINLFKGCHKHAISKRLPLETVSNQRWIMGDYEISKFESLSDIVFLAIFVIAEKKRLLLVNTDTNGLLQNDCTNLEPWV